MDVDLFLPIPPDLGIRIEFDQAMDTGVLPGDTTFQVTVDGTPYAVNIFAWHSPTELQGTYTGPAPAVSAFVSQLIHDPNCISALGTYARPQVNVQWFP